jgi:hypothetical protein
VGVEEIRAEMHVDQLKSNAEIFISVKAKYDAAKALLNLADSPDVKKWVALFVDLPLKSIEKEHDREVRTNESFMLKGQVLRLKKQRDWVEVQEQKCRKLEEQLNQLRKD